MLVFRQEQNNGVLGLHTLYASGILMLLLVRTTWDGNVRYAFGDPFSDDQEIVGPERPVFFAATGKSVPELSKFSFPSLGLFPVGAEKELVLLEIA